MSNQISFSLTVYEIFQRLAHSISLLPLWLCDINHRTWEEYSLQVLCHPSVWNIKKLSLVIYNKDNFDFWGNQNCIKPYVMQNSPRTNPCYKEQEITYKCFNENNFDKSACELEIFNYRNCTEFWVSIRSNKINFSSVNLF